MAKVRYVYFIRPVAERGPIKIGSSIYPVQRLLNQQMWTWVELAIAAQAEGGTEAERAFQKRFHDNRIRGEWFKPCDDLEKCIALIKSGRDPFDVLENLDV